MRLPDFILANLEPILLEWEAFARGIWPGEAPEPAELRDHAEEILRATVMDMKAEQTSAQQAAKSRGRGIQGVASKSVNHASQRHGFERANSDYELGAVVAEYRALRASVIRLWQEKKVLSEHHDLEDLIRFNEAIDQGLTQAVHSHAQKMDSERAELLRSEQDARNEAETANRSKDMFLATLSHEMRTPLNAIVGWLRMLRSDQCSEADRKEGLEVIERSTKSQVKLIEDVLDVSRIVTGKLILEIQPCDLTELIHASVEALRPAAEARGITLYLKLDTTARRSSVDSARLQQIVWNLVSNAIKFTPKGGTVQIHLTRVNSSSQIQVIDSGQGIRADLLPYVFHRFRQADSSMSRKFAGLGLGLSIVKHLVEAHGGTVAAYSEGEGRGATFTVSLPIPAVHIEKKEADIRSSKRVNPRVAPIRLDGLKLLVVEDDGDARRMLVKELEGVGALVTAKGCAAEVFEVLAKANPPDDLPDVLISDLGMPDQDGYELIRAVRQQGLHPRDLPAVALTAYAHENHAREAIAAGFQVHLTKPVDLHDLTSVIASLTGRTGT